MVLSGLGEADQRLRRGLEFCQPFLLFCSNRLHRASRLSLRDMQTQAAGRRPQIQRIVADLKLHGIARAPLRRRFRLRRQKIVVANNDPILHVNRDRVLRLVFGKRSIDDPRFRRTGDGFLDRLDPPILPGGLSGREAYAADQNADDKDALHNDFQFTPMRAQGAVDSDC